jgi:hypothetical protein
LTIRFSRGVLPTLCTWGGALGPCRDCFRHIGYIFLISLLMLEMLEKVLVQYSLEGCSF